MKHNEILILEKIRNLFKVLNDNNIRYCHWKSTYHLNATMEGTTDLDVLFDSDQFILVESLILELGFRRFETVALRSYPGIHDFICLDDTGIWVHLHLHYSLNLGDRWVKAYWFPVEKIILSRVHYIEEYNTFIINPDDELLIFCVRMSLKYRYPFKQQGIWDELLFIKDKCGSKSIVYRDLLSYFPSLNRIIVYIYSSAKLSKNKLNGISKVIRDELYLLRRFGYLKFKYLSLKRKSYRYYVEFRRRILSNYSVGRRAIPSGGRIIAVIGIDGAGKTSTLAKIEQLFAIQMNVRKVFLGNGRSGASWYRRIIFSFYRTKTKSKENDVSYNNYSQKNVKVSWYYAVWILICLFDKEKNLKKAIAAKANGSLVISDRWPQRDVHGTFDGSRINIENPTNWIVKYVKNREQKFLLLASLIKPDLVIRLRISPETSLERKPDELTLIEAKRNVQLLDNIKWNNSTMVDIDANNSVEYVNKAVRSEIWSLLTNKV